MSEFSDVTESLLKSAPMAAFTQLLKDPKKSRHFRSLTVRPLSDAWVGVSLSLQISDEPRERPEKPVPLLDQERHLILTLSVPPTSNPAATLEMVSTVFAIIDYLDSKLPSLRPEVCSPLEVLCIHQSPPPQTKTKLRKTRLDMEDLLKKEVKKDEVCRIFICCPLAFIMVI